jgi:predicted hydrocarbon binding protein
MSYQRHKHAKVCGTVAKRKTARASTAGGAKKTGGAKKAGKKAGKKKAAPRKEKQEVKQVIFSALFDALDEIVGEDGRESILSYAGLKSYSNVRRPSLLASFPRQDLIKLSNAMSRLLGFGTKAILKETGRKFAIYLAPYGYSLETLIEKLKSWIDGDWDIKLSREPDGDIKFEIHNDPFEASIPGCYVWAGFFEQAATSSSTDGRKYETTELTPPTNKDNVSTFELKRMC